MPDLGNILQEGLGNITLKAMQAVAADTMQELAAEQTTSKLSFMNSTQEAVNPFAARQATRRKEFKSRMTKVQKAVEGGEQAKKLAPVAKLKQSAEEFAKRNPELKANALVQLREMLTNEDSVDDILKKLTDMYPDVTLADEVLDFLIEHTDLELHNKCLQAKERLRARYKREIDAGRNIMRAAREASDKGLGTPTSLRDMYRDITGNPRDSVTMFQQFAEKYSYKDLKKVLDFLLHSLGEDLKSKGPSIARGLLHRLLTETRSLQAVLGVYRFFRGRMKLMQALFTKQGIPFPQQLTFELIAKQFVTLCGDRYPTSDKVMQMAGRLGIEKWLIAKIIVFSQLRDAVREVASQQMYTSIQHRDDVFNAIIEALENLEDELEELEEQL